MKKRWLTISLTLVFMMALIPSVTTAEDGFQPVSGDRIYFPIDDYEYSVYEEEYEAEAPADELLLTPLSTLVIDSSVSATDINFSFFPSVTIIGGGYIDGSFTVPPGGHLTMSGGTVSGTVSVQGQFDMTQGTITGSGRGVHITAGGSFYMSGGLITGNSVYGAQDGAGVLVSGAGSSLPCPAAG